MTDAELLAIEARANAATVGPWTIRPLGGKYYGTEIATPLSGTKGSVLNLWGELGGQTQTRSVREIEQDPDGEICDSHYEDAQTFSDASFIASARSDVPALIAEVRRLRAKRFAIVPPTCGCQVEVRFMEWETGIEGSVSVAKVCGKHGGNS